jgi:GNAT superfamily N-acetyltransferase
MSAASLTLIEATEADVPEIAALRAAVAERLTAEYGRGHWSQVGTEKGVLHALRSTAILLARQGGELVGLLRLVTKKPWAIDVAYFTPAQCPLYLLDMAVRPDRQRQGVGRRLLAEAVERARAFPADAIRLDAYDSAAGAGAFYVKCGWQERGRVTYRGVGLLYYEHRLEGAAGSTL